MSRGAREQQGANDFGLGDPATPGPRWALLLDVKRGGGIGKFRMPLGQSQPNVGYRSIQLKKFDTEVMLLARPL